MSSRRWHRAIAATFYALLHVTTLSVTESIAEELLGAKGALKAVHELAEPVHVNNDATQLVRAIDELPARLEKLAPSEAATAWIEVYDIWMAKSHEAQMQGIGASIQSLIDALPSPAAWPELGRLVDARPIELSDREQMQAIALRMLGHRLNGQMDRLKEDIERGLKLADPPKAEKGNGGFFKALGKLIQGTEEQDYWKKRMLYHVRQVQSELDPASAVAVFRSQLEQQKRDEFDALPVPDLVRLVGREEAAVLLEKALKSTGISLSFQLLERSDKKENETLVLARKLAREHLSEITQPHWDLCQSIETVDLFEAFSALPKSDERWTYIREYETASVYYLMGLIVRERTEDVFKFLDDPQRQMQSSGGLQLSYLLIRPILPQLDRAGHTRKVQTFLKEVLKTNPELPLWEFLIETSARLGKSQEVLPLLDQAIATQTLLPQNRRQLEKSRVELLLALDQVDEGIDQALQILADRGTQDPDGHETLSMELALRVAEIGHLLERDDWVTQGTDIAEQLLQGNSIALYFRQYVDLLIEVKQLARAERLCIHELAANVRDKDEYRFRSYFDENSPLILLLRVYHAAGRADEVLTLLEEAPWWTYPDIGTILERSQRPEMTRGRRKGLPVPLIAARSLAAAGRMDEALSIAKAMNVRWPEYDPAWQLALELAGDEFVSLAEDVFAQDAFEERPLIWLAKYYLDQGDLAKAEQLARQAIAIDPSDGEQGSGDRMRVYAVLAETLKQSHPDTARVYQGAVKAIRLAERADQFYAHGMMSRAVQLYRASLLQFADAYCIQSRLAIQLAEAGDFEGASKHYQRAFELMPESFGRVESHCFGCEGAFKGPLAVKIADQVFSKLLAEQPQHPRAHYLLGYLRESEMRHEDAMKSFQEAVRLDPDYLNAWERILSVADQYDVGLTPDERDQATFAILRLDPAGKHSQPDVSGVQDLPRLWTVLRENARRLPMVKPEPLLQLAATKRALGEVEGNAEKFSSRYLVRRQPDFSSQRFLRAVSSFIQSASEPDL